MMPLLSAWAVLGLLAGVVARCVLPGQEKAGWFATMILGLIGAILGGSIARHYGLIATISPNQWIPGPASIVSASLGAILLLGCWKWLRS